MKTYKRLKNTKASKALHTVLKTHEKFLGCYHWNPPQIAKLRRAMEFDTDICFVYKGKKYEINQSVNVSCKWVYYSLSVHCDGDKKNIRTIHRLLDGLV